MAEKRWIQVELVELSASPASIAEEDEVKLASLLEEALDRYRAMIAAAEIPVKEKLRLAEEATEQVRSTLYQNRASQSFEKWIKAQQPYKRQALWPGATTTDYMKQAFDMITNLHPGLASLPRPQCARPWAAWGQATAAVAIANAKDDGRSIAISPKMRRNFLEDPDRREQILAFLVKRETGQLFRGQ